MLLYFFIILEKEVTRINSKKRWGAAKRVGSNLRGLLRADSLREDFAEKQVGRSAEKQFSSQSCWIKSQTSILFSLWSQFMNEKLIDQLEIFFVDSLRDKLGSKTFVEQI